ncbi:hypothetical protein MCOR25_010777 [Pyricularia grisea]|nr:hypothetical protein MCOR25_010777 [Pyricularia grisea]
MNEFRREHPPDVNFNHFHVWIVQNYKRFLPSLQHPPAGLYLDLWPVLSAPMLFVYNPQTSAQFTSTRNTPKHQIGLDFLAPLTQMQDVSTLQGSEWKRWRNWLNPGFGSKNVTSMMTEVVDETKTFARCLEARAGRDYQWGPVFQLKMFTGKLTFDIIARAVLDKNLGEQLIEDNSVLKSTLEDQLRLMGQSQAFSFSGLKLWGDMKVAQNNKVIYDILVEDVQRGLDEFRYGTRGSKTKTILYLALKNLSEEAEEGGIGPDHPDMVNVIIANLKCFLVAGHETTASAMCFMYKVLQDYPEHTAKVRAEHEEVFGDDPDAAGEVLKAKPHLLNAIPYTTAVIKESLRMYQLASTLRAGAPDLYLTDPNLGIQCPTDGFLISDGAAGIHRDPDLWPMAEEFIPKRYLVPEGHELHPPKEAWRAFGRGPRDCIGKEIAMVEMKIAAVLTARTLDIETAWDEWDEKTGNYTQRDWKVWGDRLYVSGDGVGKPKEGMPVHVRRRRAKKLPS